MEIKKNKHLLQDLLKVYEELRRGDLAQKQANSLALVARQAINSGKAQMSYNLNFEGGAKIDFFSEE